MPTKRLAVILSAAAVLASATLAAAHETWLMPSNMRVATGRTVELHVTSGMKFPANELPIDPTRVVRAEVRTAGNVERLRAPRATRRSLRYMWTAKQPGVATISVALKPRTLELEPKLIEEYLTEIRADSGVRSQWNAIPAPRRWRETYTKYATSFVRVGKAGDSKSNSPTGLDFEIVPESDPTALSAGDALPIRVLLHGAPLANFPVGARREGGSADAFVITDAAGHASVPLPKQGRWLLFGTRLKRANEPNLEWRSDFVTMTFAVAPAGSR
ncbi:MAG: ABC-type Co2+ transport system periplasmic component-like protein [Gemmatimonadales bacterium]|nr:ABC-type Co2+ transport system periplasmic component-like protein [Gemmatimonadales bacterium]